jgi:hypothetical protein
VRGSSKLSRSRSRLLLAVAPLVAAAGAAVFLLLLNCSFLERGSSSSNNSAVAVFVPPEEETFSCASIASNAARAASLAEFPFFFLAYSAVDDDAIEDQHVLWKFVPRGADEALPVVVTAVKQSEGFMPNATSNNDRGRTIFMVVVDYSTDSDSEVVPTTVLVVFFLMEVFCGVDVSVSDDDVAFLAGSLYTVGHEEGTGCVREGGANICPQTYGI